MVRTSSRVRSAGLTRPLYMHGGSATKLTDVDHFEVVTSEGRKLLTITL
ncbi:hypothetical protein ACFQYP_06415 [Nonomuraea antimicrobica]